MNNLNRSTTDAACAAYPGDRPGGTTTHGLEGDIRHCGNATTRRLVVMNLAMRGTEADLADCMVARPSQLFYSKQVAVCLWFLAKNKVAHAKRGFRERRKQTLFIDARKLRTLIDRVHRELTDATFSLSTARRKPRNKCELISNRL